MRINLVWILMILFPFLHSHILNRICGNNPIIGVVTSKNGFHQLQADFTLDQLKQVHFYVVGQKTAQLIQSNGLKVVHQTNYGQELAEWLVKNHSKNTPLALTVAKKRQATFIHTLEKGRMSFKEYHLYDTILTPIKTNKHYQGLIFYSPSGIESYTSVNPILTDQSLFCIGRTTAQAAKPHSHHIHIASKPSIESVLELTKLHYE